MMISNFYLILYKMKLGCPNAKVRRENPHSDKYLHESVEERLKLVMTRRVIAKYRTELKIPAYKERKF
ncbi:MAG TPA: hypothetical protein ENK88_05620, partial [Campylobacterales bacterium]|nr:hypothetical protein [Campylobacterales bacterium]